MSPQELSNVILAIVGVILQLALRYAPKVHQWYEMQSSKGTLTLIVVAIVGCVYAGLSCTPYAAQLGIGISCSQDGLFATLRAVFLIATSQQLTYLFTRNKSG